jgi:hypothetical protein
MVRGPSRRLRQPEGGVIRPNGDGCHDSHDSCVYRVLVAMPCCGPRYALANP